MKRTQVLFALAWLSRMFIAFCAPEFSCDQDSGTEFLVNAHSRCVSFEGSEKYDVSIDGSENRIWGGSQEAILLKIRQYVVGESLEPLVIPDVNGTVIYEPEDISPSSGPWWPNELWGPDDRVGASNHITPDVVMAALQLVTKGKVYQLSQPTVKGLPLVLDRTYALSLRGRPTGGPYGNNGFILYDDFVVGQMGNVGTQFDGIAHVAKHVKISNGSEMTFSYNGLKEEDIYTPDGVKEIGIETAKPIVTTAYLLDIAGFKGVDMITQRYVVTLSDVKGAMERQGISEEEFVPGNAYIFSYGYDTLWLTDPDRYGNMTGGISCEVAEYFASRGAVLFGGDSHPVEAMPDGVEPLVDPVHTYIIPKFGMHMLENLFLQELLEDGVNRFLLVVSPLKWVGGIASPVAPIGIA